MSTLALLGVQSELMKQIDLSEVIASFPNQKARKKVLSARWELNIQTFLRICFLCRSFLNFEAELDFTDTCTFEKSDKSPFTAVCSD